jgi:hypothetical protein
MCKLEANEKTYGPDIIIVVKNLIPGVNFALWLWISGE